MRVKYRNYKGHLRFREIQPLYLKWGVNERYHLQPQWLLTAVDADDGTIKDFALAGFEAQGIDEVFLRSFRSMAPTNALFLDTEFNGHNGGLISLALVPYNRLLDPVYCEFLRPYEDQEPITPWVQEHVIPKLTGQNVGTPEHCQTLLENYLGKFPNFRIFCDHPADLKYLVQALYAKPKYSDCVYFNFTAHVFNPTPDEPQNTHNALEDATLLRDWAVHHALRFPTRAFSGADQGDD